MYSRGGAGIGWAAPLRSTQRSVRSPMPNPPETYTSEPSPEKLNWAAPVSELMRTPSRIDTVAPVTSSRLRSKGTASSPPAWA